MSACLRQLASKCMRRARIFADAGAVHIAQELLREAADYEEAADELERSSA